MGTVVSQKGERIKRKYGVLHELRHFAQLRSRARHHIIRNVLGALALVGGSVALAFMFKALVMRLGL